MRMVPRMPRMIQVGDHAPEPVNPHAAKRFMAQKVEPSVNEYHDLIYYFSDAVESLRIAVNNENTAGIRSAYLTLVEKVQQANFLNECIRRAIEDSQVHRETRR